MNIKLLKRNLHKSEELHQADHVRLIHSGNDYFDSLETLIRSATQTIQFQTYIFDEDETGIRIAKVLKEVASRGVDVFIMLDGFGSHSLSRKFVNDLRSAGINLRFFSPFFSSQNIFFGRRLHHKVIVADKKTALVGGINIANKYHGSSTEPPWLDYAIFLEGQVCEELNKICQQIYGRKLRRKKKIQIENHSKIEKNINVRVRQNDRLRRKNQISTSYLNAIKNAKSSIYITGSYFLPGTKLRKALLNARKRGVEVHLILAGVSDVPVFQSATKWLYDLLFRNEIKIYEWKKSVLHGKIALVDDTWSTVGSFNLNLLSAYGSVELNVDVLDKNFSQSLQTHFKSLIETGCEEITQKQQKNQWTAKLKRWAAYQLIRTVIKTVAIFPYLNPFKKFE